MNHLERERVEAVAVALGIVLGLIVFSGCVVVLVVTLC